MRELSISPAHPDQDTPPATSIEPTAERLADAESSLKDVLRPLLRRWIDENMAKAFEPSLRDELRQTWMHRWKQRRHLNKWRRQSRRAD
jgi:uncharacterized protein (DUF2267 family)